MTIPVFLKDSPNKIESKTFFPQKLTGTQWVHKKRTQSVLKSKSPRTRLVRTSNDPGLGFVLVGLGSHSAPNRMNTQRKQIREAKAVRWYTRRRLPRSRDSPHNVDGLYTLGVFAVSAYNPCSITNTPARRDNTCAQPGGTDRARRNARGHQWIYTHMRARITYKHRRPHAAHVTCGLHPVRRERAYVQ